MEPVSITFVVIGVVIICAEAIKYVKKKFFHHKEERHEEGVTIKAEELTMDSNELFKLTHLNECGSECEHNSNSNGIIRAKKIEITAARKKSSITDMSFTSQERGDSDVAKKIVGDVLPSIISPHADIAKTVCTVVDRIPFQNPSRNDQSGGKAKTPDIVAEPLNISPVCLFTRCEQGHAIVHQRSFSDGEVVDKRHVSFVIGGGSDVNLSQDSGFVNQDIIAERKRYASSLEDKHSKETSNINMEGDDSTPFITGNTVYVNSTTQESWI